MEARSFIFGLVLGGAVTAMGFTATAGYRALDEGIGETYQADEMAHLRGESDLLRLIAIDLMTGMSAADAEAMLTRLGVFAFAKPDEHYLVASLPEGPGQVLVEVQGGTVSDVLNHCWRLGGDCAIFEVSD